MRDDMTGLERAQWHQCFHSSLRAYRARRRVFMSLYPNTRDKPGMCVRLLLDSGPGRNNMTLICWARVLGLYNMLACRTPPPYSRKLMAVTVDSRQLYANIYRLDCTPSFRAEETDTGDGAYHRTCYLRRKH